MTLTKKTVKGIGWVGASQVIRLFIQLGITAILARLLTPSDFGLLAMVVVFTNLVAIFSDFGLSAALIQRKRLTETHLSSSFWMNVLIGFLLTLMLAALAPAIAYFYSEYRLTLIIVVLASTFFISSFGIVQATRFTKELNFKPLVIIELVSVVISGAVAVVLAFSGFGVWSLVWQQVISSFVTVIFLWTFSSWRPKRLFKWEKVRALLGFGLNLTGFSFVNYFNRNLDNLLIGKFLGSTPLGFYDLAYRLLLFPLNRIASVIGRVMFPSLSVIQDRKKRVCNVYIKATRYIAAICFPAMIGLLILAPQFVIVVFGHQWERSIFLVQILALVGLIQCIGTTTGWIYLSQGRTDIMFRWGLFTVVIVPAAFIIGLRWNVEGVAIAYAIVSFALFYPNFAIPFRFINLKFSHFILSFRTIFLATLAMGTITFAVRIFLENILHTTDVFTLLIATGIGGLSYLSLLFILDRNLYGEVFRLFRYLKS